jgi:hypothetical protein
VAVLVTVVLTLAALRAVADPQVHV